jgi:hypothetical protein
MQQVQSLMKSSRKAVVVKGEIEEEAKLYDKDVLAHWRPSSAFSQTPIPSLAG